MAKSVIKMLPVDDLPDPPDAELSGRRTSCACAGCTGATYNRVWEFLKLVFRDVNRETVEYQRPRHKQRFLETYEEEGIEQLVFEFKKGGKFDLVGYAEYAYEILARIAG